MEFVTKSSIRCRDLPVESDARWGLMVEVQMELCWWWRAPSHDSSREVWVSLGSPACRSACIVLRVRLVQIMRSFCMTARGSTKRNFFHRLAKSDYKECRRPMTRGVQEEIWLTEKSDWWRSSKEVWLVKKSDWRRSLGGVRPKEKWRLKLFYDYKLYLAEH